MNEQVIGIDNTNPRIQVYSGDWFDPPHPTADKVNRNDIAHSLALICRFTGHTKTFYSVAQHCVLMADYALKHYSEEMARWALIHDATEAYIGDINRPLKKMFEDCVPGLLSGIEDGVLEAIKKKVGMKGEMPGTIKELDNRLLYTERAAILNPAKDPTLWGGVAPERLPITLVPWDWGHAENQYLWTWQVLFGTEVGQ